jgi:hypothetical protein
LWRELKTSITSAIQPVFKFHGQITSEWDQTSSPFTGTDAKARSPKIDINQTQPERFTDSQSRAIQYEQECSKSRQSQGWPLQFAYPLKQIPDLLRRQNARVEMGPGAGRWTDPLRHESSGVKSSAIQAELPYRQKIIDQRAGMPWRIAFEPRGDDFT